jgi:hypothetical protein
LKASPPPGRDDGRPGSEVNLRGRLGSFGNAACHQVDNRAHYADNREGDAVIAGAIEMREQDYTLHFDAKHRVLRIRFGKRVTKDSYMSAYDAAKRVVAARGPCSLIADFSAVENFDLAPSFLGEIGTMAPAVPAGMGRVVVAPQPVVYGSSRIVETLRSETIAAIKVVRTIDEAYAAFGTQVSDFVAVDPT